MNEGYLTRGKMITFVGLDGSGKSTQADMLCKRLLNMKYAASVVLMKEFQKIKNKELLSFLRSNNLEVSNGNKIEIIRSALSMRKKIIEELMNIIARNEIIIMDRYVETNYVFARQLGVSSDYLDQICDDLQSIPDVQFFINVPPEICFERIQQRIREIKPHESMKNLCIANEFYHEKVRSRLYVEIDGNRNTEAVHNDICQTVRSLTDISL